MPSNVTSSTPNTPTTVRSDDQQVHVTAQHSSAATGGEVVTKGLDNVAGAAEAATRTAKDTYEAGKAQGAQAKDATVRKGKAIAGDAIDGAQHFAGQVKTGAKDAYHGVQQFGTEAGHAVNDAAHRAGAQARGLFARIGDGWRRSLEAGAGERPITFLGLNSVPLTTAGALLGLGLGVAGLFTAFTVYVPLSAILIGAGVISLLDLATSLAYRSRVKAQNPDARPLTALSEFGNAAMTDEARIAHIKSECALLNDASEAKAQRLNSDIEDRNHKIEAATRSIAASQEQLNKLREEKTTLLERQNEQVVGLPKEVDELLAKTNQTVEQIEKQKRQLVGLQETHRQQLSEHSKVLDEHKAELDSLTRETKKVSDNIAHTKKVSASLERVSHDTNTHQSGPTVKIETSSTHKNKGKHREVHSAA